MREETSEKAEVSKQPEWRGEAEGREAAASKTYWREDTKRGLGEE